MKTLVQMTDIARKKLRTDYLILGLGLMGVIILYYTLPFTAALICFCFTAAYYLIVTQKNEKRFLCGCWTLELSRLTGQFGSFRFLEADERPTLKFLQQHLELPSSPAKGIIRQAMHFSGQTLTLTALDLNYPCPLTDKTLANISGCWIKLKCESFHGPVRTYRNKNAFPFQVITNNFEEFSREYLLRGIHQDGDLALLKALRAQNSPAGIIHLTEGYIEVFLIGKLLGAFRPNLKNPITESTEYLQFLQELPILCSQKTN